MKKSVFYLAVFFSLLFGSLASAAFPQAASITEYQGPTAATSHNVTMPATVNTGDLLMMIFVTNANVTHTTPTDWTLLWTGVRDVGALGRTSCFLKVSDGTEGGGSVSVSISASDEAVAQTYRITGWFGALSGVEAGAKTEASGTTIDPPSLSPSWGAEDTLWIAMGGGADDDIVVTVFPTNYTNGVTTVTGNGGGTTGAEVFSARRELNSATEDPGAFTLGAVEILVANTVAVRSGSAAAKKRDAIWIQ